MAETANLERYIGQIRNYTAVIGESKIVEFNWVRAQLLDIRCVDTGRVVLMEWRGRLPAETLNGENPVPVMAGLRIAFVANMATEPTSALYMPGMEEPTLCEIRDVRPFAGYLLHRVPKPKQPNPPPHTTGRRLVQ